MEDEWIGATVVGLLLVGILVVLAWQDYRAGHRDDHHQDKDKE